MPDKVVKIMSKITHSIQKYLGNLQGPSSSKKQINVKIMSKKKHSIQKSFDNLQGPSSSREQINAETDHRYCDSMRVPKPCSPDPRVYSDFDTSKLTT